MLFHEPSLVSIRSILYRSNVDGEHLKLLTVKGHRNFQLIRKSFVTLYSCNSLITLHTEVRIKYLETLNHFKQIARSLQITVIFMISFSYIMYRFGRFLKRSRTKFMDLSVLKCCYTTFGTHNHFS